MEAQPDSPSLLTDLGAAYFVRAESADRPIDYGNAIEAFGKALTKSPDDPIALFNRALACERMFLYTQAVDDWEHYLRIDPQGEWAEEARRQLQSIKDKVNAHNQSMAEPMLTPAQISKASADGESLHGNINAQLEDYINLAVTNWLPKAYPNKGIKGVDSPTSEVLRLASWPPIRCPSVTCCSGCSLLSSEQAHT
jgi:tetratricopeptide (TPR) repeat protein